MKSRNLWITFIAILVVCFSILGFYGHEIYRAETSHTRKGNF